MLKVKKEPTSEPYPYAFRIREEFLRWDNVKTSHDLYDDMEVARLLLDCYDLIGGNFLIWSDKAKVAPPPLYVTLRLQHMSQDGWQVLREIKDLGDNWSTDRDDDAPRLQVTGDSPKRKKSNKRKQSNVRRIHPQEVLDENEEIDIPFDTYESWPESESSSEEVNDGDEDYDPGNDGASFAEDHVIKKSKRPVRQSSRKSPSRGRKSATSPLKIKIKKEVVPKKQKAKTSPKPKKEKVVKRKPAEPKEKKVKKVPRFAKATKVFECKYCSIREDTVISIRRHVVDKHKDKLEIKKISDDTDNLLKDGEESLQLAEVMKSSDNTDNPPNDGVESLQLAEVMKTNDNTDNPPNDSVESLQLADVPANSSESTKDPEKSSKDPENSGDEDVEEINLRPFCIETDTKIVWKCSECEAILANKHDHRKLHDRNKQTMVCHLCGNVLNTVKSWKEHMRTHRAKALGVKILCKICGQSFIKVCDLNSHMRFHSRARPHTCTTCGKAFKTNCHLKRHMLIHDVTKHFICPYCGKLFNNESNLRGHTRIHTGEKPYTCELCPAAFTHKVSLKSHKKSAHGIDMWKISGRKVMTEVPEEVIKTAIEGIPKSKEYAAVKDLLSLTGNDKMAGFSAAQLQAQPTTTLAGAKNLEKELLSIVDKTQKGGIDALEANEKSSAIPSKIDAQKHITHQNSSTISQFSTSQPGPSVIAQPVQQANPTPQQHPSHALQHYNPSLHPSDMTTQQPKSVIQTNLLTQHQMASSFQHFNPLTSMANPLTHPSYPFLNMRQAGPSEFMNVANMEHTAYNTADTSKSSEQEYWQGMKQTFTKL